MCRIKNLPQQQQWLRGRDSDFWSASPEKPTPSQINLIKNAKKSFFVTEKITKIPQVPSSDTDTHPNTHSH